MAILIPLIIAVLVFALLWYAIGLIPVPAGMPMLRSILYVLLIVVAVVWLWSHFMGGV
jgi:hypothetical protein